jgi:SAM-dependent methyltransferase
MMKRDDGARHEVEERFHDEHAGEFNDFWEFVRPMFVEPEACLRLHAGIEQGSPRHVLEIGCGDGSFTLELLRSGAQVTAIDISAKQLAVARERVAEAGFSAQVVFHHLGAEDMDFDSMFDVVVGKSILHHLNLRAITPKIVRALRSGGVAVFLEPLARNPFLHLGRKATPTMRTPTERPLSENDISALYSHFVKVERRDFHLVSLLAFVWYYAARNPERFASWTRALTKVDERLFSAFPFLRCYAWITVLRLEKGNRVA